VAGPTIRRTDTSILHVVECIASNSPAAEHQHLLRIARETYSSTVTAIEWVRERADSVDLGRGDGARVVPDGGVDDVLLVRQGCEVVHAC
jgi:hypothetical protein